MSAIAFQHQPVLLKEVLAVFQENHVSCIFDGTLGGAGHSTALLEALPEARLLGCDQDATAVEVANARLARFGNRARAVKGHFADMEAIIADAGFPRPEGILLDIGVSSHQIDTPERGFSIRYDGPLDMRMDQDNPLTAATIVNTYSEKDLADIFYKYGELRNAHQIARMLVRIREVHPFKTTSALAEALRSITGRGLRRLPPETIPFQALRIAVNDELGQLERGLAAAWRCLQVGGILAVISFHSLEDRMVKQFFHYESLTCTCPPGLPICTCGKRQTAEILSHKPITASEEELEENPRAACAKLRVARKIEE